jgi:glucan phosphorylase
MDSSRLKQVTKTPEVSSTRTIPQLPAQTKTSRKSVTKTATVNVAGSGKFSSDRTIAEYASEIWNVKAYPVS